LWLSGVRVSAVEPPRPGELNRYRQDGSLAARVAFAEATGNHQVSPALLAQARYRVQRRLLQEQGRTPEEIDALPAPPPNRRGMPTSGVVRTFALLIGFSDFTPSNSAELITNKLFRETNTDFPYESLRNYYWRSSYNLLEIRGDVLGWYTPGYPRRDIQQTAAAREALVKEALNHYDGIGHDFSQYDNDRDGTIDYFLVIWSGPDMGWGSFWWGYQPAFYDSNYRIDGKALREYSWQWEANPWPGQFDTLVMIHETGHAVGLPDYYDYYTGIGPAGGVGDLDMMDGAKGDHNCFSKFLLDWITPYVHSQRGDRWFNLPPSADSGAAVVLMPGVEAGNIFDEYFMIQNRRKKGNDNDMLRDGLLIWHVDAHLGYGGDGFVFDNSRTPHKLLRLMEADGREEIETGDGRADADDFYVQGKSLGPDTVPSSRGYNGRPTGAVVDNISANGFNYVFRTTVREYSNLGGLSGRVIDPAGNGVSGVLVNLFDRNRTDLCSVVTDLTGSYLWRNLEPGAYKVYFDATYTKDSAREWYDDQPLFETASLINVLAGQIRTGVDAALPRSGVLTGTATDTDSQPLQHVRAHAYDLDSHLIDTAYTGSNGVYQISRLRSGRYKIWFDASRTDGLFVSEWYNGQPSEAAATSVYLPAGLRLAGLDCRLERGASISGYVKDASDSPIDRVRVSAFDATGRERAFDYSSFLGFYSCRGVPAGLIRLKFDAREAGIYANEWHDGKTCFDTADRVAINRGDQIQLDAHLEVGGAIAGQITRDFGFGVEGVRVYAYDLSGHEIQTAVSAEGGFYSLHNLPVGKYKLWFNPSGVGLFATTWYNSQKSFTVADQVPVTAGAITSGIDVRLCTLCSVAAHPQSTATCSGQTATLRVSASGSGVLLYQWYRGVSGNMTAPISGATTPVYVTPALTATASYWVQVTNDCGTANSAAATVTVLAPPSITSSPAHQSVCYGKTARLTVAAEGSDPLTYQWYAGPSGDTANPINGATANAYTSPPLTTSAQYWARVSNTCGAANSNAANVDVKLPARILKQPKGYIILTGKTASLSVGAEGALPLSYQWFEGTTPDTARAVAKAVAAVFTTPPLQTTTSYWVQVRNECGEANSETATVTVKRACEAPAAPQLSTPATSAAGDVYRISWTATSLDGTYQIQEAEEPGFSKASVVSVAGAWRDFKHEVSKPTYFYYRVRAYEYCGEKDHYSEWSAVRHVAVGAGPLEPADLDGNGAVDIRDLVLLARCLAALSGRKCSVDLNGDGLTDVADLQCLARFTVGAL
jgi:M6 family metalloprotease-like protein